MSSAASGAEPGSPRARAGEPPLLELRFRPGPAVPRGALLLLVLVAVLIGSADTLLEQLLPLPLHGPALEWALAIVGFAIVAVAVALRSRTRRGPVAAIEVHRDHLVLPRSAGSRQVIELPYRDVLSLELLGPREQVKLVIGTRRHLLIYPLSTLLEPELVAELRELVREQLAASGEGERLLEQMDAREGFGREVRTRSSRVTSALLLLVAAVYTLEELSGALSDPFGLLPLGANAPALVGAGELYRLFTASFLHGFFVHLLLNALALWLLGMTLELVVGPWRFTLIYLLSALAGSICSFVLARAPISVGASGAVFGLLGAMATIQWRFGLSLPAGFRLPARSWVINLGLNALLPLVVPIIDVGAHVGGFVAGGLLGVLLVPSLESIKNVGSSSAVRGATLVVTAAYAAALIQTALTGSDSARDDRALVVAGLLEQDTAHPQLLNEIAWYDAIDPGASRDELRLALELAKRGVELAPDSFEIVDTLATLEYRLGNFDRAVALEREVLARYPIGVFESQLARFLAARRRERGAPLLTGKEITPRTARLELAKEKGPNSERQLALALEGDFTRGGELWFVERSGNTLESYGVLRLGPSPERERRFAANLPVTKALDGFALELVLIDGDACASCDAGSIDWRYNAMDPEIRALP
jgi:rhomboid protease GluP